MVILKWTTAQIQPRIYLEMNDNKTENELSSTNLKIHKMHDLDREEGKSSDIRARQWLLVHRGVTLKVWTKTYGKKDKFCKFVPVILKLIESLDVIDDSKRFGLQIYHPCQK